MNKMVCARVLFGPVMSNGFTANQNKVLPKRNRGRRTAAVKTVDSHYLPELMPWGGKEIQRVLLCMCVHGLAITSACEPLVTDFTTMLLFFSSISKP